LMYPRRDSNLFERYVGRVKAYYMICRVSGYTYSFWGRSLP
jgi:hypothetical protein